MVELSTAAEVFEQLGGTQAVADLLGAKYTAAHNWKQFGRFPPRTYLALLAELNRHGASAPPALWGMAQQEAAS